jgi:hypothetical protein
MAGSSKTAGGSRDSADFRIAQTTLALVALPELDAGAAGVAVRWAGSVALLLLVVAAEEQGHGDGDEEEEAEWL